MTEPVERIDHLKSSGSPSGGSSGGGSKHLPASNPAAPPHNGERGRQKSGKHHQDDNTNKLRGECPGNESPNAGDAPPSTGVLQVDSDTGLVVDARLGRKRHRRRAAKKKRHWKPYYKLSWEERRALDERETARASRLREEMFAKGLPVAPYNTTQFLMDEHDREEPDLNTEARRPDDTGSEEDLFEHDDEDDDDGSGGGGGGGGGSSDGIGRPGNAGGEFLQRDFSETYEMYHVESLQNMTKQELVREYLELEKCMSRLEEENNRLRRAAVEPGGGGGGGMSVEEPLARLRELERELERLKAQNTELLLRSQPVNDN
ncbi:protein HEXIM1 [Hippocampus zosterae]|uniref:protein HEXIM1 n=1 Tax=Hippocampus zosterae TaxID=109293 RepID=UPI00223C96CF|nr:protein HEXIM1 [Hippocampus zosterae]